ncbi:cation-translocating P-type ATPase [Candidatus Binatia bacterium]|jgi:Cd2+/Zn2+-exporting ATPase/Cu+-exporting ATPase|nr:cation-translocating P-type ATPase [Candidatus Binatia bacterium]
MTPQVLRSETDERVEDSQLSAESSATESHAAEQGDEHSENGLPISLLDVARIVLVGMAAVAVWLRIWEPLPRASVIGIIATLVGGYPIFKEAISALLARRMTMELSMTIALVAALAIGEYVTVLVIVFFVLVAEVLEELTVRRGRRAIGDLLDLLPQTVHLRRGADIAEVSASAVRLGDAVMVKPGGRVPVDGIVTSGHSFVDQATITGESLPVEKVAGALVYAGTVNQSGRLEVRVTGLGRDTAFGRIIQAVERASSARAPIQKTADRLAGYLVYFALTSAAFTFIVTRDVRATISVVIVAGACGIAAGTPLAILGAIGRAARLGAIIKGGIHLETLWATSVVVLDKTGTLTFGRPNVTAVRALDGLSDEDVLAAAAIAERPSEHPLGKAILKAAADRALTVQEPETFEYTPGKGIRCTAAGEEILVGSRTLLAERGIVVEATRDAASDGGTIVYVARAGRLIGTIEIADTLRPEAREAIRALRDLGLRTVLLTGDAERVASAVGRHLGVDEIHSELLPEAKVEHVRRLLAGGACVAMVGDGINDAPALMEASVGVAMGSGTDVARESASILLLGNDLLKLVATLHIARRCRRIIGANFAGTLIVDGVGVGLAAFGLLNPLLAAFIHVASELTFILNSARLLPGARAGRKV